MTFLNVLDSVRRSGTSPVVFMISSAAVYGNPAELPVSEGAAMAPISPYGHHKVLCESVGREYAQCYGVTSVICRVFSVFGPLQRRLLVWELYKQFAGPDRFVELQGTGRETRDFLHVDDLADAILRLAPVAPRHESTAVNVASGVETAAAALAEELKRLTHSEKEIVCRGVSRPGDPCRWCADASRLESLVSDWQPKPLAAALTSTLSRWSGEAG